MIKGYGWIRDRLKSPELRSLRQDKENAVDFMLLPPLSFLGLSEKDERSKVWEVCGPPGRETRVPRVGKYE